MSNKSNVRQRQQTLEWLSRTEIQRRAAIAIAHQQSRRSLARSGLHAVELDSTADRLDEMDHG